MAAGDGAMSRSLCINNNSLYKEVCKAKKDQDKAYKRSFQPPPRKWQPTVDFVSGLQGQRLNGGETSFSKVHQTYWFFI